MKAIEKLKLKSVHTKAQTRLFSVSATLLLFKNPVNKVYKD